MLTPQGTAIIISVRTEKTEKATIDGIRDERGIALLKNFRDTSELVKAIDQKYFHSFLVVFNAIASVTRSASVMLKRPCNFDDFGPL